MARWIPITLANVYDSKVAALVDACDTAATADNQAARSPGIIQGVVDEIRRKIASCQRNRLDVDITAIPDGLKHVAVDMIIARLKTALEMELSEDERRQLSVHDRNLNRIADGADVVEQPDNPLPASTEMQTAGGAQIVQKHHHGNSRKHFDGLL